MTTVLLIVFTISLLYFAIANRLMTYVKILALQGVILFGVTFIELIEINVVNLVLILLETIVVKSIAIPLFMQYVIKKNKITREAEPFLPHFVSLIIVTVIIVSTYIIASYILDPNLDKIYFVTALSAVFSGLYFISSRRKIITHVISYVIIENGVVILSLAVGNEMPLLVNLGILLDVFVSVFLLGIFINKVGDVTQEGDVGQLNRLKD
jgi:hydrogenase-4 component E